MSNTLLDLISLNVLPCKLTIYKIYMAEKSLFKYSEISSPHPMVEITLLNIKDKYVVLYTREECQAFYLHVFRNMKEIHESLPLDKIRSILSNSEYKLQPSDAPSAFADVDDDSMPVVPSPPKPQKSQESAKGKKAVLSTPPDKESDLPQLFMDLCIMNIENMNHQGVKMDAEMLQKNTKMISDMEHLITKTNKAQYEKNIAQLKKLIHENSSIHEAEEGEDMKENDGTKAIRKAKSEAIRGPPTFPSTAPAIIFCAFCKSQIKLEPRTELKPSCGHTEYYHCRCFDEKYEK
jgi:hypothetical protein